MDDRDSREPTRSHSITLTDREAAKITGVLHVDTFDDEEIVLDTSLGSLSIKGEELHMKQLDLETGDLEIEGGINSLAYTQRRTVKGRGKGIIDRLLR